jgi:hypothetical protein
LRGFVVTQDENGICVLHCLWLSFLVYICKEIRTNIMSIWL